MRILLVHPHDIESLEEPWTVRIRELARQYASWGHWVRLVFFPLDPTRRVGEVEGHAAGYEIVPLSRSRWRLLENCAHGSRLAAWADVVHFQKCHPWSALPALWGALRHDRPTHYDWDDWERAIYKYRNPDRWFAGFLAYLEGVLPAMADTVSVASVPLHGMARALGVPLRRIFWGHVGADLDRFHPDVDGSVVRQRLEIGSDRAMVLYLGQLHGAQYAERFLRAASQVTAWRDDASFVVVGGGWREPELREEAGRLGLGDRLQFTGFVSHEDVPAYLAAADIVVAAFEDNAQQRCKSPLKIAEAMAAGKAILADSVGEAPEMLGDAGILVSSDDPDALAMGVDYLLDHRDLRGELGRRARERAVRHYSWHDTAQSIYGAYRLSLHEKRVRRAARPGLFSQFRAWTARRRGLAAATARGRGDVPGPETLQIDLTDRCNNDCLACWCNSPLLPDRGRSSNARRAELTLDLVRGLLTDAAEMGTRAIHLAGGGEPTVHPDFLDVLRMARQRNLRTVVSTNFTRVDESLAEHLVELGVGELNLSLWAATPSTYAATHPNKSEEQFWRLREAMEHLVRVRGDADAPYLIAYNVITNQNWFEVPEMIRFACEVGLDAAEFTLADVLPGQTDVLLLSEEQRIRLVEICLGLIGREFRTARGRLLELPRFDLFLERLVRGDVAGGRPDRALVESIPCRVGYLFARVLADGMVNPCLKAHRLPMGSLHDAPFREIWNGARYRAFRRQVYTKRKRGGIFRHIGNDPTEVNGCFRGCDDFARNLVAENALRAMGQEGRSRLWAAAWIERVPGLRGWFDAALWDDRPPPPPAPRRVFPRCRAGVDSVQAGAR